MAPQFGVGDAKDPYVCICRAECMLAVLLLVRRRSTLGNHHSHRALCLPVDARAQHVEGRPVNFLDEERLEALSGAPTTTAIGEVKRAVGP